MRNMISQTFFAALQGKDEDKKFFYTNHKAKVGMGDLVKRGIFLT